MWIQSPALFFHIFVKNADLHEIVRRKKNVFAFKRDAPIWSLIKMANKPLRDESFITVTKPGWTLDTIIQ